MLHLYYLQRDGLLKFVKFEFHHVSSFSYIWKKNSKVFGKNTVTFWHNFAYMVNSFVFLYIWKSWLIADENYSTFYSRKCQNNIMCIAITMIHQWFSLILIWHSWGQETSLTKITYNKVSDNRARLPHHPSTKEVLYKKE